jgi:fatty acid desaturase (delta-4 desaturase)
MFSVGGFYLSFFFILSHNYEGVLQYDNGANSLRFLKKQVLTSSNVGDEWLAFLNGGLNYQIEHHLFPRINHSHYPFIAPYIQEFCKKKNIRYTHFPTILENYASCMHHLLIMGMNNKPSNYIQNREKEKND